MILYYSLLFVINKCTLPDCWSLKVGIALPSWYKLLPRSLYTLYNWWKWFSIPTKVLLQITPFFNPHSFYHKVQGLIFQFYVLVAKVQVNHAIMIQLSKDRHNCISLWCILLHCISYQVLQLHVTKLICGYMGYIASYGQGQWHIWTPNKPTGWTIANSEFLQTVVIYCFCYIGDCNIMNWFLWPCIQRPNILLWKNKSISIREVYKIFVGHLIFFSLPWIKQ